MSEWSFLSNARFLPAAIVAWIAFMGWTLFAHFRRKRVLAREIVEAVAVRHGWAVKTVLRKGSAQW